MLGQGAVHIFYLGHQWPEGVTHSWIRLWKRGTKYHYLLVTVPRRAILANDKVCNPDDEHRSKKLGRLSCYSGLANYVKQVCILILIICNLLVEKL
jgi:hypothetical protein